MTRPDTILQRFKERHPAFYGRLQQTKHRTIGILKETMETRRQRYIAALRPLGRLIQTGGFRGGCMDNNGDFYIRTSDDLLLWYNYMDPRVTPGDGHFREQNLADPQADFERFFLKVAESFRTYLDVGAFNGYRYALQVARRNPMVNIFCFEPNRRSRVHLEKNIHANGFSERISCSPLALGSEERICRIAAYTGPSATIDPKGRKVATDAARMQTLDQFCKEHDIESIEGLKVDIEGSELGFLDGASSMLENLPIMLIECHGPSLKAKGGSADLLVGRLKAMGYHVHDIHSSLDIICVAPDTAAAKELEGCPWATLL